MANAVSGFLCFKFLSFRLFEIVYGCFRIFFERSEKTFVLFVLFVLFVDKPSFERSEKTFVLFVLFVVKPSFEHSENALCILSALSTLTSLRATCVRCAERSRSEHSRSTPFNFHLSTLFLFLLRIPIFIQRPVLFQ